MSDRFQPGSYRSAYDSSHQNYPSNRISYENDALK
jgi:hypothetical protein